MLNKSSPMLMCDIVHIPQIIIANLILILSRSDILDNLLLVLLYCINLLNYSRILQRFNIFCWFFLQHLICFFIAMVWNILFVLRLGYFGFVVVLVTHSYFRVFLGWGVCGWGLFLRIVDLIVVFYLHFLNNDLAKLFIFKNKNVENLNS